MKSRFLPYAAGALSLALAAPVFWQKAQKPAEGFYRAAEGRCSVRYEPENGSVVEIGCFDTRAQIFRFGSGGRLESFVYFPEGAEAKAFIVVPSNEYEALKEARIGLKGVLAENDPKALNEQNAHDKLVSIVVRPGNLVFELEAFKNPRPPKIPDKY